MTDQRPVLVVGASGHLGGAVATRLRAAGHQVVGTARSASDAPAAVDAAVAYDFWTDDLADAVAAHDPAAVVFAASPEYVDDPATARDVDELAERAGAVADACADRRFLYVSSAAVFDGREGGYVESDDRSPRGLYGRRLVAFEDAVADRCPDHAVVRTSYQYGPTRGTLDARLARTRRAVRAGESVAYYADMFKSPVAVGDVAAAIVDLVDDGTTGTVHVPGPRSSVYAFHRNAMAALDRRASLVDPEPTPADADVALDRSLRSERFGEAVDCRVRTVYGTLSDVVPARLADPA